MFKQENGKWYFISKNQSGDEFWYVNNKLHRENGPAIILANGTNVWYFDGKKIKCNSQKEFNDIIKNNQNIHYDIKIETLIPATLIYRISAFTPEEALEKARKSQPQSVKYRLNGKKDIKGTVYEMGSTLIKLVQNLVGR